jgi:hypothetical protein
MLDDRGADVRSPLAATAGRSFLEACEGGIAELSVAGR